MSHMAQYIGGVARNLDISEVVNNNLRDDDSEAVIYGKGVGTGNGSMRYSTGSRYCIIMCIYHCMPVLDYAISAPAGSILCNFCFSFGNLIPVAIIVVTGSLRALLNVSTISLFNKFQSHRTHQTLFRTMQQYLQGSH